MVRLSLLLVALPGCLWIGGADHDARKRDISPDFELLDVNPDVWSTCAGPPVFTIVGTVAARHAGSTFDAWYATDDTPRTVVGQVVASGDGSVVFEVTPGELAPGCVDSCPVRFTAGVSHLDFDDEVDVDVTILAESNLGVASAVLVSATGSTADLASMPLSANPSSSVSVDAWPTLALGLIDPFLAAPNSTVGMQVAYCPVGVDPVVDVGTVDVGACVVVDAVRTSLEIPGDVVFEASTAALSIAACADGARDLLWVPWVLPVGHPCPAALGKVDVPPFRVVHEDCDGDTVTVALGDCDDDDALRNPSVVEVWYDGIDADCDGTDDFDRDGDGVAGGPKGLDCDDEDALAYPGAIEICDDADNDCDGNQLIGKVTVHAAAGSLTVHDDLTSALAAAASGDTVRICPGTFVGNFTITNNVVVIGSGSTETTLQGAGAGAVIDVVGTPIVDLSLVRITGGTAGGIRALGDGSLVVTDCVINANSGVDGAGIATGGTTVLDGVELSGNTASGFGGGLDVRVDAEVTVIASTIVGNTATEGGGAIIRDRAVLDLDDTSTIAANSATRGGGVLMVDDAFLFGGTVEANVAIDGGGVYTRVDTDTYPVSEIEGVTIQNHTDPGIVRGGAVFASATDMELHLHGAFLNDNVAGSDGGAVYIAGNAVGAAVLYVDMDTLFERNAAGSRGGAVFADDTYVLIYGAEISDNTAIDGGGLYITDMPWGDIEAVVQRNDATDRGGGLFLTGNSTVYNYYDAISLVDNTATTGGGGYLDDSWLVTPDTTMTGNVATGLGGGLYITGAVGHSGMWGTGTISGNLSASGESNGVYLDNADSYVSCPQNLFSDTVMSTGVASTTPTDPCFSLYTTNLDDGQCSICP